MADRMVVGVYSNESDVISAIRRLHEMGYESDEISVLAQNPERFGNLQQLTDVVPESPKSTAGGAATGAVTGGILGGIGALLVSLGVLAIPGVGPFLAAGPVVAAIGGAAGGAAVGGVVGALIGLGVDKGDAQDYEHALERGDLLVMVRADEDRYNRVSDIFRYPEDEYYRHYDRNPDLPWNAAHAGIGTFAGNPQNPHTPPMAGVVGMGHAALDVDRADGAANDRHHDDDIHPDELREDSLRREGEHRRADGSVGLDDEGRRRDADLGRTSGLAGGG
ncbi:MAG TPA: general stress protein [Candidatus Limnocylindria bacterium]|nr:general stress protein [Candidatus Limnocylindria bacterium]